MAEPRPKPSLRVDTRVAAPSAPHTSSRSRPTYPAAVLSSTSALPPHPPAADGHGHEADSPTASGASSAELSIWWDGEVIDESDSMLLRRGRLTITEKRKRPPHSTKHDDSKAQPPPPTASAASPSAQPTPSHNLPSDLSSSTAHTLPVLLKTFKTRRPSSEAVLRLRYDFEAFQHLHFDAQPVEGAAAQRVEEQRQRATSANAASPSPMSRSVPAFAGSSPIPFIKPLHLLHDDVHGMALIYRDSGGRKLSQFIGTFLPASPSLPSSAYLISFLHCALALTDVLSALHSAGVIYRALCPANSLYDPTTRMAQLLDFSQSSLLSSEKQAVDAMAFPINSLPYTAPEATGRMNRSIDSRSDLYSLGCTLMELLTSRPPFLSSDPMEIIHCHLAKHPPPIMSPAQLAAAHPALRIINDIVQKLLQKPAEDRYQSTAGLKADLVYCMHMLTDQPATALSTPMTSSRPLLASDQTPSTSLSTSSPSVPPPTYPATVPVLPRTISKEMKSAAAAYLEDAFQVGRMDLNSIFRVSQKLYGRSQQVATLLSSFDRVAATGRVELVLVSGYSGIGKTSLVDEVHKPIVREKGLFIRGKFDLYKRNVSCILEAFSSFILQLLADDAQQIERWRKALLAALGANAAVIIDVIPELAQVIGEQPAVPKLPPDESQFRFDATFAAFLSVFAAEDHPLVLFTDDLQWADSKSLQLIRLIFTQEVGYVLLICAYRDNEVSATHPFIRLVNDLKLASCNTPRLTPSPPPTTERDRLLPSPTSPSSAPSSSTDPSDLPDTDRVHTITLTPLRSIDILELVQDTLHCTADDASPLVQLLIQKTSANPFYLYMMLQSFYADHLITFDFDQGRWVWDLEQLRVTSSGQTNDVVDLLCVQIGKFTHSQQEMMRLAACLGNVFSLQTLAVVAEKAVQEVAAELWEIIRTGLVISIGPSYEVFLLATEGQQDKKDAMAMQPPLPTDPAVSHHLSLQLRFMHDRVQQAAYRLIPTSDVRATHIRIGRLLLQSTPPSDVEPRCFDLAEQMNHAAPDLLSGVDEAKTVIRLNIAAGERAKASVAYDAAVKYLEVAMRITRRLSLYTTHDKQQQQEEKESKEEPPPTKAHALVAAADADGAAADNGAALPEHEGSDECWSTDYELTSSVHRELAEAVYLSNDYPRAVALYTASLAHTTDSFQRVLLLELLMQPYIQQHQMRSALDTGLEALRVLGIDLVPEIALGEVDDPSPPIWNEAVLSATEKPMTDPTYLAGMRILASLCAPCYVLDGVLFGKVACTMVRISCEQGPCPLTAVGLGLYCILLNGFRRFKSGWLVGQKAMAVLHGFPSTSRALTAKVYGCYYAHNWQYHRKLSDALPHLQEAVNVGLEAGDLEWSGYDTFYVTDTLMWASTPLDVVARCQQESVDSLVKRKQLLQSTYLNIWRRLVLRLQLRATETYSFHGKLTTDADILHHLQETQNHMFLFTFHLAHTIHLFLDRRFSDAVAEGEETALHAGGVCGMLTNAVWSFWYSLALLYSIPLPMHNNVATFPRPPPVPGAYDFFRDIIPPQPGTPPINPQSPSSSSPGTPSSSTSPSTPPDDAFPYSVSADFPTSAVESILLKVVEQQTYLAQLAQTCPANFLAFYLLLEAERARIHAHVLNHMQMVSYCVTMYDAAIATARQHGLVYVEALAHECTAYFFLSIKRMNEARTYMRDAHFAYARWGCTLKVSQIQQHYGSLLKKAQLGLVQTQSARDASDSGSASSQSSGESMTATATASESMSPNHPLFVTSSSRSATLLRQSSHTQSSDESTPPTSTVSRLSTRTTVRAVSSHSPAAASPLPLASTTVPVITGTKTPPASDSAISLESLVLLRACAAFSVETNLSKLLRRVMQLLIQHANANKGFLALVHEDMHGNCEWRVEVQANIEDEDPAAHHTTAPLSSMLSTPLQSRVTYHVGDDERVESPSSSSSSRESSASTPGLRSNGISIEALTEGRPVSECLPVSVFNLVVSTQSTLLLSGDDLLPTSSSPFARDPYFVSNHPKSLLCAPIKQQSKLVAVLYLENQFFAEAFSTAHVRVCEIVCIQAALSISNARLYSALEEQARGLEQTVAERTSELEEKNEWLQAEISERQLAQEAMRKAKEDAEQATKSKSDFLSNMSHEIRTPMNAVLGLSRLLADTELSAEQSQYLSMITSSGELLLSIINDILDFSKIESQKLELEHRSFSLLDCVENAVQLCYDMAGKKGLDLTYLVDPQCPAVLVGDVTRLQQIILNLLSNACKFTKQGEVVLTVTARALGPSLPAPTDPFYQTFMSASPSEQMSSPSPITRTRRLPVLPRPSSRLSSPPTQSSSLAFVSGGASGSPTSSMSVISSPAVGLSSRSLLRRSMTDDNRRVPLALPTVPSASSPSNPSSHSSTTPSTPGPVPPPHSASPNPIPTPIRYRLLFAVRDSGIGIREDVQKKLFNSFTQAESSTTRRFGGTGLGLAISKRLAEAMGGEMWLTSSEGQGSTFYFTITTTSGVEEGGKEDVPPTAVGKDDGAMSAASTQVSSSGVVVHSRAGSQHSKASPIVSPSRPLPSTPPVPMPPSSVLHSLSVEEVAQLKGLHVLIVCERPASAKMFVMLALSYAMRVLCVDSVAKAVSMLAKVRSKRPVEVVTALALLPASDSPTPAAPPVDAIAASHAASHVVSLAGSSVSTPTVSQAAKHKQDVSLFLASLSVGKDAPASTLGSSTGAALPSPASTSSTGPSLSPSSSLETCSLSSQPSKPPGPSASLVSGLAHVPHVDVLIFDCDGGDYDDSVQTVEAALQAVGHPSLLCVVSSRRREDRRNAPTPANVFDIPSPHPSHSQPLHSEDEVPAIQAHNLNLTQEQLMADDRRTALTGPEPVARSLTPLPPSPHEAGDVEVMVVMRPLKQRDLLKAICGALTTLEEVKAAKVKSAPTTVVLPDGQDQPTELQFPTVLPPAGTFSSSTGGTRTKSQTSANAVGSAAPGATVSAPGSRAPIRRMPNNPASQIRNMAIEAPLHILLAEDNKINQKMMSMLLGKLGYKIVIAENGREVIDIVTRGVLPAQIEHGKQRNGEAEPPAIPAVALLEMDGKDKAAPGERTAFDVILMDVSMEEMDGLQCTEFLRANYDRLWPGNAERKRRPYIIACTANASSEFQKKCEDVGMDDWVSKPVEIQQLVRALHAAYNMLHRKTVEKK